MIHESMAKQKHLKFHTVWSIGIHFLSSYFVNFWHDVIKNKMEKNKKYPTVWLLTKIKQTWLSIEKSLLLSIAMITPVNYKKLPSKCALIPLSTSNGCRDIAFQSFKMKIFGSQRLEPTIRDLFPWTVSYNTSWFS